MQNTHVQSRESLFCKNNYRGEKVRLRSYPVRTSLKIKHRRRENLRDRRKPETFVADLKDLITHQLFRVKACRTASDWSGSFSMASTLHTFASYHRRPQSPSTSAPVQTQRPYPIPPTLVFRSYLPGQKFSLAFHFRTISNPLFLTQPTPIHPSYPHVFKLGVICQYNGRWFPPQLHAHLYLLYLFRCLLRQPYCRLLFPLFSLPLIIYAHTLHSREHTIVPTAEAYTSSLRWLTLGLFHAILVGKNAIFFSLSLSPRLTKKSIDLTCPVVNSCFRGNSNDCPRAGRFMFVSSGLSVSVLKHPAVKLIQESVWLTITLSPCAVHMSCICSPPSASRRTQFTTLPFLHQQKKHRRSLQFP